VVSRQQFGDDEDRVLVRANGSAPTSRPTSPITCRSASAASTRLIDVLGADHHGYVARVRGGLVAMGEPGDCLEVCLIQFVSLYRGGREDSDGQARGQFVTLRQLREEVGNDACRLFYLMRSHDQPLDFDLELAKSRSNDNPVYYMQYAHARVCERDAQLEARALNFDPAAGTAEPATARQSAGAGGADRALARYPEVIEQAATARAPHGLVHYLRELANTFHSWYNAAVFIVDDAALRNARLALAWGVRRWCAMASRCSACRRRRACERQTAHQPRLQGRAPWRSGFAPLAAIRHRTRPRPAVRAVVYVSDHRSGVQHADELPTPRRAAGSQPINPPLAASGLIRRVRLLHRAAEVRGGACRRRTATCAAWIRPPPDCALALYFLQAGSYNARPTPSASARSWHAQGIDATVQRVAVDADCLVRVRIGPIKRSGQAQRDPRAAARQRSTAS
jgi:hypothetical protein